MKREIKRKIGRCPQILIFVFAFFATAANAEKITLKSGEVIYGKVLSQKLGAFKVKSAMQDVATYYLYEIESIDGNVPSMDDPFYPLINKRAGQPEAPKKVYLQEEELFFMTLPTGYQWLELPHQITISNPIHKSLMLLNFSRISDREMTPGQKQKVIRKHINQHMQVAQQREANNFQTTPVSFAGITTPCLEYRVKREGRLRYTRFIPFYHNRHYYSFVLEGPSQEEIAALQETLDTLSFGPFNTPEYFAKGKKCFQYEQFDLALRLFRAILDQDPDHVAANYWAGRCLFEKGTRNTLDEKSLPLAREQFQKVIALEPRHTGALRGLGLYYTQVRQFAKANACLRKLLEIKPHDPEGMLQLAQNYTLINAHAKAVPLLKECLKREPDNPDLHLHLAVTFDHLGQTRQAMRYVQEAKSLLDKHADHRKYEMFKRLERELKNKLARKEREKYIPKITRMLYIVFTLCLTLLFIKGLWVIKQSVYKKEDEIK
jgi:tetratricopeptide (TPR) repeat protein